MKTLFFLCLLLCTQTLYSQSLSLFDIDTTNFPTMKAKFFAFDAQRKQQSPNIGDMTLKENGELCTITNITCTPPKQRVLSVCIMVDTYNYIDIARLGTQRLIGFLDMPQEDEVAVTYMEGRAAIWQDFTKDKNKALAKAQSIPLAPGVDVNTMFYSDYTGGIPMIKDRSSKKKVLILVSDLHCPIININESKVIADAKKYNISIYTVLLGTTDYSKLFSRIAAGTSGKVFENVNNALQIENVFDTIAIAENNEPCDIEWQAQPTCTPRKEIELTWQNQQSLNQYTVSLSKLSSLQITPSFIGFGTRALNISYDTTITITARNADFTVTGVNRNYGSADFTIVNTNFPFTIPQNESRTITLRCIASDSSTKYASFEISSKCPFFFSAGAIFPRKKIITNTLKVVHPNGGEQFVAGSDSIITWTGISPTDTVRLDYSIDGGKIWKKIIDKAVGLQYHWKNIPLPTSNQCLIRVTQISTHSKDSVRTLRGHNYAVRSIEFSPDGSIFASGSFDGTIKIWDANTGKELRTLAGHFLGVYSVAFSPDGRTLASGGEDTIKIWDVSTGKELRTLTGHTDGVFSVAFSPDGIMLASGSWRSDATIKIWDVSTGKELRTLTGHTYGVSSVVFSPDSITLASGGGGLADYSIKIWDVSTGKELRTLTGHASRVHSVALSPDGITLASGGDDKSIKIWNANTGAELRTLKGHTDPVYGVAFSPDGVTLASGSFDRTVRIWDANTGKELRTLRGHNDWVYSVAYSPDGRTLASGSQDKTIKIWEIEPPVLQEDQSDAVFSIIAPVAVLEKRNIDMGKVLVGSSKDTMVTAVLCNKGDAVLHVLGVDVTNGDRNEFIVPRGAGEFYLEPNTPDNCRAMMFAFMPNRVGKRTAQITIRTTIGDFIDSIEITGEGIQPQLAITEKFIDFGKVGVGDSKDSVQCATIQNIGTVPITIIRTSYGLPNDKDFSTITGNSSFVLNPGKPQLMDLRFSPSDSGRTSGTLEFHYNGLGSPAIIQLFGEGITVSARGAIKTNTISGYAGEEIEIPIQLTSQENIAQSGITSIDMELSFNPTLLSPIGYSVEIINDTLGKISMKNIPIIAENGTTLHTIRCIVGLGNAEQCALDLSNLTLYGGTANINVVNGKFTLLGICEEGGTRLINPGKATSLMRIHPNPSKGIVSVDLELIEQGLTKVRIMDIQGNVMSERELNDAIGSTTVIFDMEKYGAGVYYIEVRTPTIIRKEKIMIEK